VKRWCTIRANIKPGLTTDTPFFIRNDCVRFWDSLPSSSRADRYARSLLTLLTDNGHEDRNLFPFRYSYPRKGRATGALMGKAADHFTGLASGTAFWNDRNSTHLDNLLVLFFIENISFNK